jgi:uncharacterized protein with PQ loop repeat
LHRLSNASNVSFRNDPRSARRNENPLSGAWLNWLPVATTVFAVPQFLPQLTRIWRTGDTAGVSWSWAALTTVSNGGWIAYFALSRFWTALVPATSVTVLAGTLAVLLSRRGVRPDLSALTVAASWTVLLALAWLSAGRIGLGTALALSFVLQVTPSVWTAYRTERPTGLSAGTWLLILAELVCWGIYGLHKSDARLIVLGCTGVVASTLMLARTRSALRPNVKTGPASGPPRGPLAAGVTPEPAVTTRRRRR